MNKQANADEDFASYLKLICIPQLNYAELSSIPATVQFDKLTEETKKIFGKSKPLKNEKNEYQRTCKFQNGKIVSFRDTINSHDSPCAMQSSYNINIKVDDKVIYKTKRFGLHCTGGMNRGIPKLNAYTPHMIAYQEYNHNRWIHICSGVDERKCTTVDLNKPEHVRAKK